MEEDSLLLTRRDRDVLKVLHEAGGGQPRARLFQQMEETFRGTPVPGNCKAANPRRSVSRLGSVRIATLTTYNLAFARDGIAITLPPPPFIRKEKLLLADQLVDR